MCFAKANLKRVFTIYLLYLTQDPPDKSRIGIGGTPPYCLAIGPRLFCANIPARIDIKVSGVFSFAIFRPGI